LKLFHHKLQFFKSNPHFAIVVFSDGLLETSQTINEGIRSIMILKTKYLKPIISEAITTGKFKSELEVEDVLHLIMGSLRLQMLKWRMADFSFDIVVAGDRQISNILKLIKK
jgi:TetR/AcrR family fatty acid metabolism transcriptional regulator